MKRSTSRILTTHVGSLPRPADLLEMGDGRSDPKTYEQRLRSAVAEIVSKQVELGIDVIDDGEYSKPSFVTYINERLGGFETDKSGSPTNQWSRSREALAFPEYYNSPANAGPPRPPNMVCTGPITYKGHDLVKRDIENFKAALGSAKPEEAFMPAISPSNVEDRHQNAYYKTEEEFLFAIADALAEEYKAIVAAGFLIQIDDPRLVSYYALKPGVSVADCQKWAGPRIAAVNHALRDIPTEKIRFHTCYSINMGPRIHDMQLKDCIDMILGIRAGAYSFEAANPRHEHEWKVWESAKLPKDSDPDPRRHLALDHAGRAPGTGGAADRTLRQGGRARECDRRLRLRLRHLCRLEGDSSQHRVGEVQVAERRRGDRQQRALELSWLGNRYPSSFEARRYTPSTSG